VASRENTVGQPGATECFSNGAIRIHLDVDLEPAAFAEHGVPHEVGYTAHLLAHDDLRFQFLADVTDPREAVAETKVDD
jgi:hypothetical protein